MDQLEETFRIGQQLLRRKTELADLRADINQLAGYIQRGGVSDRGNLLDEGTVFCFGPCQTRLHAFLFLQCQLLATHALDDCG